jgi:hypothetical protein
MKKVVVLVIAALALAVLMPAQASARHTLAHRVKVLEAKVKALRSFTHNCLGFDWVPIGWYGDFTNGTFGYLYDNDGAGPVAPFYTSALDVSGAPEQTTFIVAVVNPNCVSKIHARSAVLRRMAGTAPSQRGLARRML